MIQFLCLIIYRKSYLFIRGITGEGSIIKDKIVRVFNYIFTMFFCVILINCIFFNKKSVIEFDMKTALIISILFFLVCLTTYLFILKNKDKISARIKNKKLIIIITALLVLTIQIIIARCFYYPVGWDVRILRESGKALFFNEPVDYSYFQMFPNNVLLLWVFKNICYISNLFPSLDYEFALVIFNIIVIDLGVLMTILVSKKIFGSKLSVLTGILSSMLLIFSPWMNVVYSDTIGLFFPVLIFYLYLKCDDCKKTWSKTILYILIGLVSVIAFQVKPTNIIILIAIFISMFFFRMTNKKEAFKSLGIIVCISLSFVVGKYIYNNSIGNIEICGQKVNDNDLVVIPSTHFLMMGMQEQFNEENQAVTYGSWKQSDYFYTFSFNGREEKVKAHIREIKNRLNNFGTKGYIKFLYNKANWILHDGTFYYGGEGGFVYEQPSADNKFAEVIQEYYVPTNSGYVNTAYVYEGVWIAMLFLIIVSVIGKEKQREDIFILRLTITGIIIFLLFFEARSRYLINHLPILILLSVYGFSCICSEKKGHIK